jgi:hypothetical protein
MLLVQCARCGKFADVSKPIVFRHADDSPMEPDERPQPWVRVAIQSLQPTYILPNGAPWPAQEREICDDCLPIVLTVLSADLSAAVNVNEPAVPSADLIEVVELANKVDPVTEPEIPDQSEVVDVGEIAEVPAEV